MRRDMEYVRLLLINFSKGEWVNHFPHKNEMSEEQEKYIYHLELMKESGLISYEAKRDMAGININNCPRLTWEGNDFLDAIENENVWNRVKENIKEKGLKIGELSFEILKTYASNQTKIFLGIE